MRYQYIPYIWPLIASALITLSLGVYALIKRRNAKGALWFILSMGVLTLWSLANSLEMSGSDFETKLFWANVQYIAYCYSPVTLVTLCMEYTGYDGLVRKGRTAWLAVLPTIILLLVWTDGFHGLVRSGMTLNYGGLFPVIDKKYGPVFYIHSLYSYGLNFAAWAMLLRAALIKGAVYRKQALCLFAGVNLIVLPNLIYITGLLKFYRFDVTPVFFGPAGAIAAWGIFRFRLFDVVPIAWANVVRNMDAGVLVLDTQNRILDVNPAFERISSIPAHELLTKQYGCACGASALAELNGGAGRAEFTAEEDGERKVYEGVRSPLTDSKDKPVGSLIMLNEITEKKRRQQELLKQQWQQAVEEERERTARDLHDRLGQVFGFLNLQAQGIRKELKNAGVDTAADRLDKLVEVTQTAHADLRAYIRSIRNPAYCEIDFLTALKKDTADFECQTGLCVALEIPCGFDGEKLKPHVRIHVLNIIREALNNIAKHAEAEHVRIALSCPGNGFQAAVEDDGIGFDATQSRRGDKTKFGLDIMRERAEEIGGSLTIESAPGKGCRIVLTIYGGNEV